jgi:hypothetical protein
MLLYFPVYYRTGNGLFQNLADSIDLKIGNREQSKLDIHPWLYICHQKPLFSNDKYIDHDAGESLLL